MVRVDRPVALNQNHAWGVWIILTERFRLLLLDFGHISQVGRPRRADQFRKLTRQQSSYRVVRIPKMSPPADQAEIPLERILMVRKLKRRSVDLEPEVWVEIGEHDFQWHVPL